MKAILILLLTMYCPHVKDYSETKLTITISHIPSSKGNIMIAVYNSSIGFMEKEKTFRNLVVPAQKGSISATIDKLPVGNYAIAVFHDANNNGKLDKNLLGVPTEYYGFSNDAKGTFGPPSFESCILNLNASASISINLH